MGSVSYLKEMHKELNASSSLPLIGLVPSSIHLAVSVGQTITGVAGVILFSISSAVSGKQRPKELKKTSIRHLKDGMKYAGYNLINLATLSVFLTIKERDREGYIKKYHTTF